MLYQLTYDRDDSHAAKYRKQNVPYSSGESRVITLIADSDEEALEIATKRLAKQYPDDRHEPDGEGGIIRVDGSEFNGDHRPDLAQSNYVLREIAALEVT